MTKLDKRAKRLAEIVVDYSTSVKKGELVAVNGPIIAVDFIEEIAKRVIDRGADPVVQISSPAIGKHYLQHADEEVLKRLPKFSRAKARECDAWISVSASKDPLMLKDVDPQRIALSQKTGKPITDIIIGDGKKNKGKRWCVVGYPTRGVANLGGMTLKGYANILYKATNIDWSKESEKMKGIKDAFDGAEDVHIYVPGMTDLHLSLKGRGGEVCDGKFNMPDGEVFYGPVEDSAEGIITFTYPAVRAGNLVDGIKVRYKAGKAVEFSAKKNQSFLEQMLAIDGAKRVGELGIGCNPGIQRYMKNLLFDEKIGGTIHLALGMSYPMPLDKGGGKNKCALHWDIVCDLRKNSKNPGGYLAVNGKKVQEDGHWLF